jgi:alkylation response protein AidB-like acyl-CoA dehydrogenase
VDFDLGERVETFRREVRTFFGNFRGANDCTNVNIAGSPSNKLFRKAIAEKGWISASWPIEYGGQARNDLEMMILAEEAVFADLPLQSFTGSMFVANALLQKGSDWQKETILPHILRGEIRVCLGYSEPDAGSDVAAVKTRAIRDGDDWVITGQKMFTSHAMNSQYVFLLCRTNPEAPKRKNLTMFLVPLDSPGIEIHPIEGLGDKNTTITYYRDVPVSDRYRVGDVDGGWSVLNVALTFEHGGGSNTGRSLSAHGRKLLGLFLDVLEDQKMRGIDQLDDELVRERIGRAAVENEVSRLLELRTVWRSRGRVSARADGSIAKLYSRESLQRIAMDCVDFIGVDAVLSDPADTGSDAQAVMTMMLHSLGGTIYGGTSEIQRSIIAERGLGLPRSRRLE